MYLHLGYDVWLKPDLEDVGDMEAVMSELQEACRIFGFELVPGDPYAQFWGGDEETGLYGFDFEDAPDEALMSTFLVPVQTPEVDENNLDETIEPPAEFQSWWGSASPNLKAEWQRLVTMGRLPKTEVALCFRMILAKEIDALKQSGESQPFVTVCGYDA